MLTSGSEGAAAQGEGDAALGRGPSHELHHMAMTGPKHHLPIHPYDLVPGGHAALLVSSTPWHDVTNGYLQDKYTQSSLRVLSVCHFLHCAKDTACFLTTMFTCGT